MSIAEHCLVLPNIGADEHSVLVVIYQFRNGGFCYLITSYAMSIGIVAGVVCSTLGSLDDGSSWPVVTAFSYSIQLQVGQTPGLRLLPFSTWSFDYFPPLCFVVDIISCGTALVLSYSAPILPGSPGLRKGTLQQYSRIRSGRPSTYLLRPLRIHLHHDENSLGL
jgi:hypothetical protein